MTATEGHEPEESYAGPARVGDVEVRVLLRGRFEPVDGRFHWWGRVDRETALPHASGSDVTVETPHGRASGRLSDLDPWGRLRVSGTGRPPF